MKFTKTHKTIVFFILYCVLTYFIMVFIVKQLADKNLPKYESSIVEEIFVAMYHAAVGLFIYFCLINLTSIIGLIIAKRRKDLESLKAFKITTVLTAVFTGLYILLYY